MYVVYSKTPHLRSFCYILAKFYPEFTEGLSCFPCSFALALVAHGELLAPLEPAALKYCAACRGAHTGTESVASRAFALFGLIGSFGRHIV